MSSFLFRNACRPEEALPAKAAKQKTSDAAAALLRHGEESSRHVTHSRLIELFPKAPAEPNEEKQDTHEQSEAAKKPSKHNKNAPSTKPDDTSSVESKAQSGTEKDASKKTKKKKGKTKPIAKAQPEEANTESPADNRTVTDYYAEGRAAAKALEERRKREREEKQNVTEREQEQQQDSTSNTKTCRGVVDVEGLNPTDAERSTVQQAMATALLGIVSAASEDIDVTACSATIEVCFSAQYLIALWSV